MAIEHTPVSVTYSDTELRNLVEEYISQQKSEFRLKGVCSYFFYQAVEDGKIANANNMIDSNELQTGDQGRVKGLFDVIVADGRIVVTTINGYAFNSLIRD